MQHLCCQCEITFSTETSETLVTCNNRTKLPETLNTASRSDMTDRIDAVEAANKFNEKNDCRQFSLEYLGHFDNHEGNKVSWNNVQSKNLHNGII